MGKGRWRRFSTCRTAPVRGRRAATPCPCTRPPGGAVDVADRARGHGPPRAADPVLGAGWGTLAGDGAFMGPSALSVAADGRLFVAFRASHLHSPRGAHSLPGRGEPPRRAGTRGPYQPRPDAPLSRGRSGGHAHARRAPVNPARVSALDCTRPVASLPAGTTGLATVFPESPTLRTRPRFVHG